MRRLVTRVFLRALGEAMKKAPSFQLVATLLVMAAVVLLAVGPRDRRLLRAAAAGSAGTVSRLLALGAHVDASDEEGRTALYWAVRNNHKDAAQVLLDRGADVNLSDQHGMTPLLAAVSEGADDDLVWLLLAEGADPNLKAAGGTHRSALHLAIVGTGARVAELLASYGADVNERVADGRTLLHVAVERGADDTATILLSNGADTEARDPDGHTPLHVAAREGHGHVVWVLTEHGADGNAKGPRGRTPLHLAITGGQEPQHPVLASIAAQTLLKHGADVSVRDEDGRTALHLVADQGRRYFVRVLLDAGADVNAEDNAGNTPLTIATQKGRTAMARSFRDYRPAE